MKVLVTGAAGFLGTRVVRILLQRGHSVRALVRSGSLHESPRDPLDLQVFRADLGGADDLAPAFEGVDVVVHLAAALTGGERRMRAATVAGTQRLLAAMVGTDCRRIVLASTFAVYDWSAIERVLDEDSPLESGAGLRLRDAYAITKLEQEQLTRCMAVEHGWDLTVLRPGYVWGRGRPDLAACGLRIGRLHLAIGPRTRLPLTYVDNCADLFVRVATDPKASGQTFNVVDGPGERIWRYLGDHLRHSGERAIRIPLPYGLVAFVIQCLYQAGLRRLGRIPGLLIPRRFHARFKPLQFSNQRVRERLQWSPPFAYAECMRRTYTQPDAVADSSGSPQRL